ncbi:hypothetical protein MTR67_003695 [Solanum verrucosum]|uniref:Tf2-1-like SH3-like domain-containing protein n=1 Tax=Solanum verrucosum TaxID=315347 RepID=A0AAF0PUT2_SOLVR|nr:hypothetical protein MTR67_003695 [Solanum verrucosum]
MKKVQLIRDRLKTAQSRQKSYANVRRRELEFQVDDWVFLKVSPMKGVMRFGKKGKLSPRYVGSYKILKRVGKVAYELELPTKLVAAPTLNTCVWNIIRCRSNEISTLNVRVCKEKNECIDNWKDKIGKILNSTQLNTKTITRDEMLKAS